ncbi:high-potential iron-sulfur protein [Haloarchaeobius sp. HRN-SO-5]|uniref:high-potential iron-sulfur protein n=1 Tax=Haloarchaeobius sp. HRN-SO-5 TaxID=3446118 RepID=UPI003EBED1B2
MELFEQTRRRFVRLASGVTAVGLAGCVGGDGESPATESPSPTEEGGAPADTATTTGGDGEMDGEEEELPEGVSEEEFVSGPVPEEYRTATSQAGEQRDPDGLVTKEAARFQEASEAVAAGLAPEGQTCENCEEFIPDKNGDGFGACVKVEGYIGADDWCGLWEAIDEDDE